MVEHTLNQTIPQMIEQAVAQAVEDAAGIGNAGITPGVFCFRVADTTAPFVVAYNPLLGAPSVPMEATSFIELTFNEPVTEQSVSKIKIKEGRRFSFPLNTTQADLGAAGSATMTRPWPGRALRP